jgi:hypothetical protein
MSICAPAWCAHTRLDSSFDSYFSSHGVKLTDRPNLSATVYIFIGLRRFSSLILPHLLLKGIVSTIIAWNTKGMYFFFVLM